MNDIGASLPEPGKLLKQRLALLRTLAESLEFSTPALVENDVQAIARGATHQAELCRQWSVLEDQLHRSIRPGLRPASDSGVIHDFAHSGRLKSEWEAVAARIRYVTRVHCSLLRYLQRSLAVLHRVVDTCAPTYSPDPAMVSTEARLLSAKYAGDYTGHHRDCAGVGVGNCAGECAGE